MNRTEFKSISKGHQSLFKDRGSKFIGFTIAVQNELEIKEKLESLRQDFPDANHHCYAFRLFEGEKEAKNDDGEPSYSAGEPILSQIKKYELFNTLIVVVRYFGGTKLGVGGLINAYRTAAEMAIENSKIQLTELMSHLELNFDYDKTKDIQMIISEYNLVLENQEFNERCKFKIAVKLSQKDGLINHLEKISYLGIQFEILD